MVATALIAEAQNLERVRLAQSGPAARYLNPVSCRMARASLSWSQAKLAAKAHMKEL
jgi:hypothetical protein